MEEEKPSGVQNEKLVEDNSKKIVTKDEGELAIEKTANVLEKETVMNKLLADIEKANLRIEQVNVLNFVLQNFKNRKILKDDTSSEDEVKSKEKKKKLAKKSDLSIPTKLGIEPNMCKTNIAKAIEIKQVTSESKEKPMKEGNDIQEISKETKSRSCKKRKQKELKIKESAPKKVQVHNQKMVTRKRSYRLARLKAKPKKARHNNIDRLPDIKEMVMVKETIKTGGEGSCMIEERVEENLKNAEVKLHKCNLKMIGEKSDFSELVQTSQNDFHKKVTKRKTRWDSGIKHKVRKEDCSIKLDEIEKEYDDKEFELVDYVEHNKTYFFVPLAKIACKLCSYKGKPIVQHYKILHPESEVLISRINPIIAEVLIEDAVQNRQEYDKDHPEHEKTTCSFKCPFCLKLIEDTSDMYYNHISNHTGEYCYHCNHCSYWTYNHTNIHSHLNQMHNKINKTEYRMVYPDPKISKYVFGYVCSECNFIQLIRTTVEEHAMVYHSGSPEIHKVNLGVLLHEDAVDENQMNEILLSENHLNLKNCTSAITFTEDEELSVLDSQLQIDQLEEGKVEIELNVLEDDSQSTPLLTDHKEEELSSEVKQLVLTSGDHSKSISVQTDVSMTDIEKQSRSCPQVMADTMEPSLSNTFYNCNLSELVPPYNCADDGFPSCPFKTLYLDEYLKHVNTIYQIAGLCSSSSEHEPLKEAIMEWWLAKEVGPFQCAYCKKATVTHQEMREHQAVFHNQKECLFYYRKFVSNDTVTAPEQVNLEDPSFINHVIHLPNQAHLCDFQLTDDLLSSTSAKPTDRASEGLLPQPPATDPEISLAQQKILFNEPEIFSLPVNNEMCLLNELDLLSTDINIVNNGMLAVDLTDESLKCRWEGCYKTYHIETPLVNHIEKDHVELQRGEKFTCFWFNCPRKSKPFNHRYELLIHIRVHGGEEPYKCPFQGCNKAFPKLQNLNRHQMKHTGERLYSCEFSSCYKTFSRLFHKMTHQKMHDKLDAYQVTDRSTTYTNPNSLWGHVKEGNFMLKKSSNSSNQTHHYAKTYAGFSAGCWSTGIRMHYYQN